MSENQARRPRRVIARALGMGIACLAVAGMLAVAPAATTAWNQGAAESTLWQLMNGARVNNGLAPVQSHGTLVGLARWRSSDMLQRNYFSHTIPGCGCLVYAYYDSNGVAWQWAGENIGWNSGLSDSYSPVRVHEAFMGSPSHRVNVLDARFSYAGVGAAAADNQVFLGHTQNTRMYTQLFLQPKSAAPPPAPAPQPQPAPAPGGGSGGGSGGGGGGAATAPATRQATNRAPRLRPMQVRMDGLARPQSSAGIDGVAVVVSTPVDDTMIRRLKIDETAAARAAAHRVTAPAKATLATAPAATAPMQVSAPAEPEPGLLETIVGGLLGFLFG